MDKEKSRGSRAFRWALVIIALVNVLCIAVVLCVLWQRLEDYEEKSPVAAMDAFFADVQAGRTAEIVARLDRRGINTAEDYTAWLQQTFSGDAAGYRYAPVSDGKTGHRYAVYDENGERKGEVRLFSENGETGPWTVQPAITYLSAYTVRAPAYVRVLLNGRPLPDSVRTDKSEPVALFDAQRDENRIPHMAEYVVEDLLEIPAFTAQTPQGEACLVTQDDEARTVTVHVPVTGDDLQACEQQIETVAKLYARYISQDAQLRELAAHIYKDTDFYDAVRAYDGQYYNKHISYAFEKFTISNVERFSEDTFAGDVSFDYVIKRTHDTHTFPTKYRMGFQKIDGKYQLVELRFT